MHDVKDIVEFTQTHRAIFVVGMERGGTSVVFKTLRSAPGLGPQRGDQETFIFDTPGLLIDRQARPRDMTIAYMGGPHKLIEFRNWYDDLTGWPDTWMMPRKVASAFFYFIHKSLPDGTRLIEKTPRHAFHLDLIARAFPAAGVVGVLRNPFGVIESYAKRLEREREMGLGQESWGWLDRTPEQIIAHIDKIARAVVQAKEKIGDRMVLLDYDKMLRDPERAFAKVADRFEIAGLDVRSRDAVSDLASGADPLLRQDHIVKENRTKSRLAPNHRAELIQAYPDLFAACGMIPS